MNAARGMPLRHSRCRETAPSTPVILIESGRLPVSPRTRPPALASPPYAEVLVKPKDAGGSIGAPTNRGQSRPQRGHPHLSQRRYAACRLALAQCCSSYGSHRSATQGEPTGKCCAIVGEGRAFVQVTRRARRCPSRASVSNDKFQPTRCSVFAAAAVVVERDGPTYDCKRRRFRRGAGELHDCAASTKRRRSTW